MEGGEKLVDEQGLPISRRMLAFDYWAGLSSAQKAWVLRQVPERYDASLIIRQAINYVADHLIAFDEEDGVLRVAEYKECPSYILQGKKKLSQTAVLA